MTYFIDYASYDSLYWWLTFEGEFHATVRVKGVDFEYSCEGNACPFPREARDSAAAQMLTKFRSMA